jgi:hypothetical protein
VLIIGETFNQHKAFLWSLIHSSQELIKVLQNIKDPDNRKLAREIIVQERTIIKSTYAELKELQKWFTKSGMEADQPYKTPGMLKREAEMTEEEWDQRLYKAQELDNLLYEQKLKTEHERGLYAGDGILA